MGILEGKNILVAGVTMNTSIGYRVAEVATEQGATVLVSNFGRALSLTKRIVKRLDPVPPVLDLDVTNEDQLAGLADQLREHVDHLDGVVHSIAFANPETALGSKWELVSEWSQDARRHWNWQYMDSLRRLEFRKVGPPATAPAGVADNRPLFGDP